MPRTRPPQTRIYGELTPRDREILRAREKGESYASIAARLRLSRGRVGQIVKRAEMRRELLEHARESASSTGDPLETPVELLPLSTRAVHVLRTYGKTTLRAIAGCTPDDLLRMKNLGHASVREILDVVRRRVPRPNNRLRR